MMALVLALVLMVGAADAAPASPHPGITVDAPPLFAGLLQDVVGNRTRLIQVSFLFILVGIFILWKK
jgi:hypothetical protein